MVLSKATRSFVKLTTAHHLYGRSTESTLYQGELLDTQKECDEQTDQDAPSSEVSRKPVSSKPKRQPLPAELPRKVIRHDAPKAHCPDCGDKLHCIGEDASEKLVFISARVKVEQHVRLKCVCQQFEKQGKGTTVYQAPVPATVFPKSIATPSLVAHLVTMKFQYGLPLTRIASLFSDLSII